MLDNQYTDLLSEIKEVVEKARIKAISKVNQQLLFLYWEIGQLILDRQNKAGWGAKVIESLSKDLSNSFPDMRGFSVRNLRNMRKFAEAYPDFENMQPAAAQLSWTHHIMLLDKFSDEALRLWYMLKSVEQGWSKRVLKHQIDLEAHKTFGSLPNNFDKLLPQPQSEAVQQLFKDEYIFDFIAHEEKLREKDLEEGLIQHIRDFLLALGKGFSYVGNQYHLSVEGQDFYIDLLFYHFRLKCFVVIELKIDEFKPEYVGKLNFYLSAVDDLIKRDDDQPSIGLLLCATKNKTVVEYALRDVNKPMGVASYKLTHKVPENLKDNLPTEQELKKIMKEIGKRGK